MAWNNYCAQHSDDAMLITHVRVALAVALCLY